jgi:microcystin degradation protein MlrC
MSQRRPSAGPLRIGIAGIAIESSTFSPHRTGLADFTVTRGDALLGRYDWLGSSWARDVEWVPLLHAVSLPGGPVEFSAYDSLKSEIISLATAAGPLDGLLYDIHGAMTVVGLTDAEADLADALRSVLGPSALISASMDLHGNVSARLAGLLDLATCYRTAPHVDTWETRERAARLLVERLRSGGKPLKAWVPVPVLLPGEKTSTRLEPAASLYEQVRSAASLDGVLDAAIWVGYAWADEPRCHAAVVVTGDSADVISSAAQSLAEAYWAARDSFAFVAPAGSLSSCLATALASDKRPYFISDSGDNPTAGGADDVSWTLGRLLEEVPGSATVIYASVVDPAAVSAAFAAGKGGSVAVDVGGKIDSRPSGPVPVRGTVYWLLRDDPVGGDIAVIQSGGLRVILTSRRKPYHHITDFTALGLDVSAADLVVVKIGYLEPELYEAAADWMLALTPGGVDQDLLRLGHHNLGGPVFPFNPDMPAPDLTPRLL